MSNKIQFRRGNESNLPVLSNGEPAITTDTQRVFVGATGGNVELAKKSVVDALLAEKANQEATNSVIALKADKSYVDTQIQSIASGSPKGVYATLSALQTAFPTGNTNTYVVQADGKWYYWNGSAWTSGGTYQAALADASSVNLASTKIASNNVKAAIEEVKDKVSKNVRTLFNANKSIVTATSTKYTLPYNVINNSILEFTLSGALGKVVNITGYKNTGKNLFNKGTVTTGKYADHLDGNVKTASTQTLSDFIPATASTSYVFGSIYGIKFSRIVFYDANKVFISGMNVSALSRSITAVSPANTAFLRVSADTSASSTDSWQVETGSVATDYVDYKTPVSVTFPKTVSLKGIDFAKDTFDSDGVLTTNLGQKTLNGSVTWYEGTATTNCYVFYMTGWATANNALVGTANSGQATSSDGTFPIGTTDGSTRGINLNANGNLTLFIEKNKVDVLSGATTLEKFKSYLNTYPIDFIFKLATPVIEQVNFSFPVAYAGGTFEIISDITPNVTINVVSEKQVLSPTILKTEDVQLEKAGQIHSGGYRYTAFGGGAMVGGKEVHVFRTAPKHTTVAGDFGKVIAYIKDKYGNWTTKKLELGVTGGELRDINLSLPYDGSSDVILSATKYTGTGYEYTNWIFRLDKDLNLKYSEQMLGTEGLFAWGNVLFTPQGRTIKAAYDQNFGGTNRGVFICRREADTNNYSLIELFPADPVNPNEINIGYWGDKLVAICRQRADYSLYRETTDLEGLTGWSEPRKLSFKAHAPQIPCYTPKNEPLIITFSSVTDELVSQTERYHRDVSISATYNGVDWHLEKIMVENNHYGGYTSFIPNGANRFGMTYFDDYDTTKSNYKDGTDVFYKVIQLERYLTDLPYLKTVYQRTQ